ncbi:YheT family hydrolase [Hwanghaeella grinnelliae]|uniref:YheT family hydrolase n=1 Tax=Hwanghaeella grinnelliae TaxID=2500179 RepID=UPI00138739B1|nr:alpha/beta fold hydrolase [Hwanghaeella grinnelliae]
MHDDPFQPRAPWLNGDLQTIRNFLVVEGLGRGLTPPPSRRMELPLNDGTGDTLLADLSESTGGRGLVVLVHGLSGCAASAYMKSSAAAFDAAGYSTLRLNLRGAGPSAGLCGDCYHSGRTEDLANGLRALDARGEGIFRRGLYFIGFSLGGNMLLKFLAEYRDAFPITAAATVCAPIDLAAASRWFDRRRNRIYQRRLLDWMRRDTVRLPLTAGMHDAVLAARTVYEFDEVFTAPRFGFEDAADYYDNCSARRFLDRIETPSLLVEAKDDPWVPSASYDAVDWHALPHLHRLSAEGGGHVGFHGQRSKIPWHDRKIIEFFKWVNG